MKKGKLVILSAPSGTGKTSICKELLSRNSKWKFSVSATTREKRKGEINGKDYFFVTKSEFEKLINDKKLLEHAKVFNNLYGTSKKSVLDSLSSGKNVIFDIDWQGTKQIKSQNIQYKIITFFVLPPSKKILFERLSNRDMKDKLIASERMKDFYKDVKHWVDYDFVVINDDLDKCFSEISKIVDSFRFSKIQNIKYDKKIISKHIEKLIN